MDLGTAAASEPDSGREGKDDRVREKDVITVEVVDDVLDVLTDLWSLVSEEMICVVA